MPESYRDKLEFRDALDQLEEGVERGTAQAPRAGREAKADEHPSVQALVERMGADVVLRHEVQAGDEHVIFLAPDRAFEILGWLKDEQGYDLLKDVTGVDYGGGRPLQVVYELWSIERKSQLRVKVELPLDALEIPSVVSLWHTADWLEREVYDLFGVEFADHPDLRRIMMPENYAEGHPLRKDFPLRGRFSRAEQTRRALSMDVEDFYIPDEMSVYGTGRAGTSRRGQDPAAAAAKAMRSGGGPGADAGAALPPMRPEGAPGVPGAGEVAGPAAARVHGAETGADAGRGTERPASEAETTREEEGREGA